MSQWESDTNAIKGIMSDVSWDSWVKNLSQAASDNSGYDFKNGRINERKGGLHALDEAWGGMSGRNTARHAAGEAGDAVLAAQAAANLLLQQQNEKKKQMDIQASDSASATRETAKSRVFSSATTTPMAFGSKLGGSGQDYLGA